MALQKQPFTLPLAQGMQQKKNPRVLTGGISLVENGVHRKDQELKKRPGWTSLPRTKSDGTDINEADACATYENELLVWSENHLYTFSEAQERWYDRGPAYSVAVDTRQIIASNESYGAVDSAYDGGIVLVAYQLDVAIRYQMYDHETGAILLGDTGIEPSAVSQYPKCLALAGSFYVIYSNASSEIKGAIINPQTGAISSTVTIASDLGVATQFDVLAVASDTLMLAYRGSSGLTIKYLNTSLGARGGSYSDSATAVTGIGALRLIDAGSGKVMAVYSASTETYLQARTISATGSVGASVEIPLEKTIDSVNASAIAGHDISSDFVRIYVQYTASDEANNFIWYAEVSKTGSSMYAWPWLRSVGLATRAFVKDGRGYVGIFHKSPLQSTFFVADQSGVIVSRHQPGTGGAGSVSNCLASVWSTGADKYEFSITNKTRVIAITDTAELFDYSGSAAPSATNLFSPLNVAITSLDFQNNANFTAAELGGSLLVVGGVLSMYDGLSTVEQNFLLYPEGLSADSTTTAGSVPIGSYLYAATYEWTDAKGLVHQSAPSIPLSVSVASAAKKVSVTVPTLRLTMKKPTGIHDLFSGIHIARSHVKIVLWRTDTDQTGPFYRVSSITSPTENDPTVDSVVIQDNVASPIGREILYSSGGILDNVSPAAAKYMKVWRGRLMLAGGEEQVIQFSKPLKKGRPVEFAAENTLEIESDGGPATALEILDDKLICFKEESALVTFGEGPDASGLSGSFAPLTRIALCDVGCIDQQSTAALPGAVLFKSLKGYYMLGGDLAPAFIGADVEDYNDLSVTSATLFATENEVRITNSDGVCLVYNYYFKKWSVFTNHEAEDAERWQGSFFHLKSDGKVCLEVPGTFRDDDENFDVSIITGWQSFADIIGFQRIYRAHIVGDYVSPLTLSLHCAYDGDDTWIDSGSIGISAQKAGWQFFMKRQKCESMRFKITAAVTEFIETGEGMRLTAMGLLFGLKAPMAKIPSAQKTGLSTI